MVAHALWYKQIYSYSGVLEALSGMPFDVQFISFDDILENEHILDDAGVIINAGDAYTAFSGGDYWKDERIVSALRRFVYEGGGFIGVGEPSAAQKEGHFFQLYDVLGVDKEVGFSLSQDKYNWQEQEHFLKEGLSDTPELGEEICNIYALRNTRVLINERQNVRFAANEYGKGRSVYLSGLPFSFENARLLYRCLFYAAGKEADIKRWYSENCNVEVNVYPNTDSYCVVNNTYEEQSTRIYTDQDAFDICLKANEIRWFSISGKNNTEKAAGYRFLHAVSIFINVLLPI